MTKNKLMAVLVSAAVLLLTATAFVTHTVPALDTVNTWTAANTFQSVNGVRFADQYAGADIFAKANAAAAAAGSPGLVIIPPGTYNSVTTTLNCADNVLIEGYGVTVNYSGTGIAIKCANIEHAGVKGLKIIGPGTGGSAVGLQLGVGSGGTNIPTQYNYLYDLDIRNFGTGVKIDGYLNNGTYNNSFVHVKSNSNGKGWDIRPTAANYANLQTFTGCMGSSSTVGDGWIVDGSNGNTFTSPDLSSNAGWGMNFPGTQQTKNNNIIGFWGEANVSGDFNSGSATNVFYTHIIGGPATSTPNFSATGWTGIGNSIEVQNRFDWYVGAGGSATFHFGSGFGINTAVILSNDDASPPSGLIGVMAYNRTGANAGNLYIGTPEFPATMRGTLTVAQTTVGALPTASSNAGAMILVTDSTAVSAEGQTCVGSSSSKALAVSNGTGWKCF